ncbi:Rubrerythrin [Tistlia consotensis]|uniref:Rubrerythrin n=1 Tax=Tistlia consotensis USBA 355 TaxID=560819 RepID=A0A1Y6BU90_9PROT|nr:ferritin family protein [Tistlia consotensis]SMF21651.1 Rubrerythrin [Tistlia consotensis USBA 355]SNR46700.1 Rubrerythrin [Tistlia consotensis]
MPHVNRRTLSRDPSARVGSLAELVGIAHAVETEAIRRYRWLAQEMRRRDEAGTADAFEAMAEEEETHVAAVETWAEGLGTGVSRTADFRWRLPPDLAESWEAAVGSALLTPYRAYAIAVDNEERAFAFYSYLAAASDDPAIAREAEHLASEELRHAARLRTWRRAAWRREASRGRTARRPQTPKALAGFLAEREAAIAACHRQLAERLQALGDQESAALLAVLAAEAAARTEAGRIPEDQPACDAEDCRARRPVALLLAAQRPLEALCEDLEDLELSAPTEALQAMAQTFLADAIARIARIGRRLELIEGGQAIGGPGRTVPGNDR